MESAPRIELAAPTEDEVHVFHDRHKAERDRRVYIGMNRDVAFNPESAGAWQDAGDSANGHLWVLSLRSATAYGVQVHFRGFQLPMGAKLFLYAPGHEESAQIFLGAGPYDDHDFWSTVFDGDEVRFELEVPDGIPSEKLFDVTEVGHLLVDPRATVGTWEVAGACNLDAACYPDWHNSAMSVARVLGNFDGLFACSGTLINNQSNDGTPYFLTADHCFGNDAIAHTATFYWHYANDVCNAGTPAYGPTTYGAKLLATSPDYLYDSSLLLMDTPAPAENTYSGWNTNVVAPGTALTSVHHPSASWRRISFGTSIKNSFIDYPDDIAVSWSTGITEPGSSGGPAFDANHDIVGLVSRGRSSCTLPHGTDLLAPFAKAYPTLNDTGKHDYLIKGSADDIYAPNQTRATATVLSVPFSTSQLILKTLSDDWFHISVAAGAQIRVTLGSALSIPNAEYFLDNESVARRPPGPDFLYVSGEQSHELYLHLSIPSGTIYLKYSLQVATTNYSAPGPFQWSNANVQDPYTLLLNAQLYCQSVPTDEWFEVSQDPAMTNAVKSEVTRAGWDCYGSYFAAPVAVEPSTTYYWRAVAQNALGTTYSKVGSITTNAANLTASFGTNVVGFPTVKPGQTSTQTVWLYQTGNVSLNSGIATATPPFTIPPSQSCCIFQIKVTSSVPGIYDGTLSIVVHGKAFSIPLHAEFSDNLPNASLDIGTLDFGVILPQLLSPRTRVVTLTNSGTGPLTIFELQWGLSSNSPFTHTTDCGSTLLGGRSCHFFVTFHPIFSCSDYATLYSSNSQLLSFFTNARVGDIWVYSARETRPTSTPPPTTGGGSSGVTAPIRPERKPRSTTNNMGTISTLLPLRYSPKMFYAVARNTNKTATPPSELN